jgi:hypothetical protein
MQYLCIRMPLHYVLADMPFPATSLISTAPTQTIVLHRYSRNPRGTRCYRSPTWFRIDVRRCDENHGWRGERHGGHVCHTTRPWQAYLFHPIPLITDVFFCPFFFAVRGDNKSSIMAVHASRSVRRPIMPVHSIPPSSMGQPFLPFLTGYAARTGCSQTLLYFYYLVIASS